jgi:hypothetical protein
MKKRLQKKERDDILKKPFKQRESGALEKWLNSPPFQGGIHGFESRTRHHHSRSLMTEEHFGVPVGGLRMTAERQSSGEAARRTKKALP